MPEDEILAMKSGIDLDALVARQVMEFVVYSVCGEPRCSPHDNKTGITMDVCLPVLRYSKDISPAWQVVEKMRGNVSPDNREGNILFGNFCGALIEILNIDNDWDTSAYNGVWSIMKCLMPEAICKAALIAVDVK